MNKNPSKFSFAVANFIEFMFNWRLFVFLAGIIGITFVAIYVSNDSNGVVTRKDIISSISSSTIIVALFYTIITYEYNRNKFKHDVQLSKDTLAFNIALEWHKATMIDHLNKCRDFIEIHRSRLTNAEGKEFYDELCKNPVEKSALISVLNFFEAFSLAIHHGVMGEDLSKEFFLSIVLEWHKDFAPVIRHLRTVKRNDRIYKVSQDWHKNGVLNK